MLIGLAASLAVAAALSAPPARADDWCGFQQKANSRVRCGYSSLQECKQSLTDKIKKKKDEKVIKDITCMPDPSFG